MGGLPGRIFSFTDDRSPRRTARKDAPRYAAFQVPASFIAETFNADVASFISASAAAELRYFHAARLADGHDTPITPLIFASITQ